MASRGRGCRGRPRGSSQAPPVFDQQAFAEAVGITAATIAYASAAGSQGGPNNLQRFRAHHPPIFTGGGDLMVADHWFMQVGEDIGGDRDYLRYDQDQTSCISTRGRGPSVVELVEDL